MTRTTTCPVCRGHIPADAAFCPGCGRRAPGTLVLETPDDTSRDGEVVIGHGRGRRSPLALAAVVAVILAGVFVVSRDQADNSSPATTTTAASTSTTTAPTTSTTAEPATTTTSELVRRVTSGPILGGPTGLIVYIAVPREESQILYALDIDQGVFREIATASYSGGEVPVLGDAILVATATAQSLVHPDGAGKLLGDPATTTFSAGRPDAYWKVTDNDDGKPAVAIRVVIGAPEQQSVSIPIGFIPISGDGLGGLLLRAPDDRIYRLLPDSDTFVALEVSNVLDAENGHLAAVACDEQLKCPVEIVDLRDGTRRTVPGSARSEAGSSLAPDGAHLAQITRTPGSKTEMLVVTDTVTGDTLLRMPFGGLSYQQRAPLWSPDGRWLFWNDIGGLEVWNIDRIQPQTVDVPSTDRSSMYVVAVAAKT